MSEQEERAAKAKELLDDWATLSADTRDWMAELGSFGPTYSGQIKGHMDNGDGYGKTYLGASDCHAIAAAMTEVAEWLERRMPKLDPAQSPA